MSRLLTRWQAVCPQLPQQYLLVERCLALFLVPPHSRPQLPRFLLRTQFRFQRQRQYLIQYRYQWRWLIDRVRRRMNYRKYRWSPKHFHRFLVHYRYRRRSQRCLDWYPNLLRYRFLVLRFRYRCQWILLMNRPHFQNFHLLRNQNFQTHLMILLNFPRFLQIQTQTHLRIPLLPRCFRLQTHLPLRILLPRILPIRFLHSFLRLFLLPPLLAILASSLAWLTIGQRSTMKRLQRPLTDHQPQRQTRFGLARTCRLDLRLA